MQTQMSMRRFITGWAMLLQPRWELSKIVAIESVQWWEMTLHSFGASTDNLAVAYFSMEFGLEPGMPTYSGGLGILAADTVRAAADMGLPMVAVSLLHRKGYFRQTLDRNGNQTESDVDWSPGEFMELLPVRIVLTIAGRQVQVQVWRYVVHGQFGHTIPVLFLDTGIAENSAWDREITDHLYQSDQRYRFCQEVVLGLGGICMLRALGYKEVQAFHMNEGHSALITLALMEEQTWGRGLGAAAAEDREAVRQRCVFTTHTPVSSGHERFHLHMVRDVIGNERADFLLSSQCCSDDHLNMTYLALNFARYVNGVSMRHEEVSRNMFSSYPIDSVTNGVHAPTWTSVPFQQVYDAFIPEWRRDNLYLRYAIGIPLDKIQGAHSESKQQLIAEVERRTGVRLSLHAMTLGFARRATAYKRIDLLFRDVARLKRIVRQVGPLQIVCAGKAYPTDEVGKALIRRVFEAARELEGVVQVVYLEEYDMNIALHLCAGTDLWINTPQKPQEASGTSGMKAALNGVPSLSILDGWWVEGHVEGVTGWSIGDDWQSEASPEREVASLYDKLEYVIVPMYYERRSQFAAIMRSAISLNGSYFNAQRMLGQYQQNAYLSAAKKTE